MMDARSEKNLVGVHPDLVKVLRATPQTPQPFIVICGLRSEDAEAEAVATHHSQTMHSRHGPNKEGFGCAVDVLPLINGVADYAKGREPEVFGQIASQVKDAAEHSAVEIEWGGDAVGAWEPNVVSHFRDWGHFQLPWAVYP